MLLQCILLHHCQHLIQSIIQNRTIIKQVTLLFWYLCQIIYQVFCYYRVSCFQELRVLQNISRQLNDCTVTTTVDDMQGTKYLLRNKNISNANNFTSISNGDKGECRKDIGELTTLYRRNRGIEAVAAGGGIILS